MMLGVAILLAAQAAAPMSPAAAEAQVRKALAARGMSTAGIEASLATSRRHQPALAAIVQRGQAAEAAIRASLARRPVDIDGFARSMTARADAAAAMQREGTLVAIDQMRALSPADRIVVAQMGSQPAPRPAAPAASRR